MYVFSLIREAFRVSAHLFIGAGASDDAEPLCLGQLAYNAADGTSGTADVNCLHQKQVSCVVMVRCMYYKDSVTSRASRTLSRCRHQVNYDVLVSPDLGLPSSLKPKYAVNPGIPSAPTYLDAETCDVSIFEKIAFGSTSWYKLHCINTNTQPIVSDPICNAMQKYLGGEADLMFCLFSVP